MLSNTLTLTPEHKQVIDLIENHRGLVINVFDETNDGRTSTSNYPELDTDYFDQMLDPVTHRPSRSQRFFDEEALTRPDVLTKMNLRTLEVSDYKPGQCQDPTHKQTTKKTSSSLIPPDPRYMETWRCDSCITFLWDINDCNLKNEQYTFMVNAGTDSGFWFDLKKNTDTDLDSDTKIKNLLDRMKKEPLGSIELMRAKNLKAIQDKKSIEWNEILVGLPRGPMKAIMAPLDDLSVRLRALRAMKYVKEKFNLTDDLPLFVCQPYYSQEAAQGDPDFPIAPDRPAVFRPYTKEEQEADLQAEQANRLAAARAADLFKNSNALGLLLQDEKAVNDFLNSGMTTPCSTTLLPTQPQWMNVCHSDDGIVLLWDINQSKIDPNTPIEKIRADNADAVSTQTLIEPNKIMAQLEEKGFMGVVCLSNDYNQVVKSYKVAQQIKEKFKLDVMPPVWISVTRQFGIGVDFGRDPEFRLCTDAQRLWSEWEVIWNAANPPEKDYVLVNHPDPKDENDYVVVHPSDDCEPSTSNSFRP